MASVPAGIKSIADLEANGAEFAILGEVLLLRCLADELRQERERQGLTRERLAERLRVSPESLADLEAGTFGTLTLAMLSRIAHALGNRSRIPLLRKWPDRATRSHRPDRPNRLMSHPN